MYDITGRPVSFRDYDPKDSRWQKLRHNSGTTDFTDTFYYDGQLVGSRYGNRYTGRVYRSELSASRPCV